MEKTITALENDLFKARSRAWRTWEADGLPQMTLGTAILVEGVGIIWGNHTHLRLLPILLILLGMAILIFKRKIINWLKSNITYPRTGYAKPPSIKQMFNPLQSRKTVWVLCCSCVYFVVLMWMLVIAPNWYFGVSQTVMGGLLFFVFLKTRFAWWILLPLPIGTLTLVMFSSTRDKLDILMVQIGAQCFVIGLNMLLLYLKDNRIHQP